MYSKNHLGRILSYLDTQDVRRYDKVKMLIESSLFWLSDKQEVQLKDELHRRWAEGQTLPKQMVTISEALAACGFEEGEQAVPEPSPPESS